MPRETPATPLFRTQLASAATNPAYRNRLLGITGSLNWNILIWQISTRRFPKGISSRQDLPGVLFGRYIDPPPP
ncbi:hypothetical protein Q8A64_13320 [Oxalobacteraceae bacterium R-40]|uniref:Uncharacterized protein n=1 Tax=Keguizhuia sedimenti TaxID=3064264 RepID=A0ABU1BQV5_9BURK|nr:hypothetical protein [Oxalobacteraceae bacterium R-40]